MTDIDIGLDFKVEEITSKELGKSVFLVGEKHEAPGFMFSPTYSVGYPAGEMVVTVLAGKSLGQRRFDCYTISETRHMDDYAILRTVLDTVLVEQHRIAAQEALCHEEV